MRLALMLFKNAVCILLSVIDLALLVRAVMSWFPMEPNKFTDVIYAVTEPVLMPVRKLFYKMNWFQNSPIDVSFFVTYVILNLITAILVY